MDKPINKMSYKEFCDFCNDRAADGRWSFTDAVTCIAIVEKINSIKIKKFGITMKKRTEQAREEAWEKELIK